MLSLGKPFKTVAGALLAMTGLVACAQPKLVREQSDLVVPVALAQSGARTGACGAFSIKRVDFRIGDGDWNDTSLIANDVRVRFRLSLTGVPAL